MQRITKAGHAADAGLIFHVFVMDSTSTSGAGKASIGFGSFTCYYIRAGAAISGAITPQDIATIGTYAAPTAATNIRIKAVDNANMIGVYEIQLHLDWVATGSEALTIFLTASGAAPVALTIPLVGINVQDGVRLGVTALPNAAADAAGGLPISDAGGLDLDAQLVTKINDILTDTGTTLQAELDGIQADTEDIQTRLPAALTLGGNIKADMLALSGDGPAADNAEAFFDGTGYAGTNNVIPTVMTLTGHTPQTGDGYAIVNHGTHGNAALKTLIDAIDDFIDTEVAAVKAVTDLLIASDAEPTGVPAATATPLVKLAWLFKALIRRVEVTATKKKFFNAADAAEWEKDLSDDGTTYTETTANAP